MMLFEGGGGALPEYTSQEGGGVEVPDWCHAPGRQLGPLVINGFHWQFASGGPSWRVPAAACMRPASYNVAFRWVLKRIKK